MIASLPRRLLTVAVVLCVVAPVPLARAVSLPDIPWQLPEWKYREIVELMQRDPAGKVNTALVELAESPPRVAPDGADIRVLDEQGNAVAFELVTQSGEPLRGDQPAGEPFRIHFRAPDSDATHFAVYFGNPDAAPAGEHWAKKTGGLTLETRANSAGTAPGSLRDMLALLSQSKMKYGDGPRRQINDTENPFGPNEQFISVYRGLLYCPDDGPYIFGTDSDDASFLLIDGQAVAQQAVGRKTPPGVFEATGKMELKAGLHRIEYYHVQLAGGSLARAGWQPPGATAMETIPEESFVRELRTRPVIVEARENPVNAFFTFRPVASVQFNNKGPVYTTIAFTDGSRSAFGAIPLLEWDFGDGSVSCEAAPSHVFESEGKHLVTLRCTDRLGFDGVFSKEVSASGEAGIHATAELEAAAMQSFLLADEAPDVKVSVRFSMLPPVQATLATELHLAGGSVERYVELLDVDPGKWISLVPILGDRRAETMKRLRRLTFALRLSGNPVAVSSIDILSPEDDAGMLSVEEGRLLTGEGRSVILRLNSDPLPPPDKPGFAKLAAKGGMVDIAVLDDSLAGEGDGGYPVMVAALARARYPDALVTVHRVGLSAKVAARRDPLAAAVEAPSQLAALKPDVVVLAVSLRDVLRLEPVERFERNLQALVERTRAATGAHIILVAPPPLIINPALSQAYALAVKRVGMRKKVEVADAYSAFLRAGELRSDGWRSLYRDSSSETPLYLVSPAAEGQKLIAETVFKAMEKE